MSAASPASRAQHANVAFPANLLDYKTTEHSGEKLAWPTLVGHGLPSLGAASQSSSMAHASSQQLRPLPPPLLPPRGHHQCQPQTVVWHSLGAGAPSSQMQEPLPALPPGHPPWAPPGTPLPPRPAGPPPASAFLVRNGPAFHGSEVQFAATEMATDIHEESQDGTVEPAVKRLRTELQAGPPEYEPPEYEPPEWAEAAGAAGRAISNGQCPAGCEKSFPKVCVRHDCQQTGTTSMLTGDWGRLCSHLVGKADELHKAWRQRNPFVCTAILAFIPGKGPVVCQSAKSELEQARHWSTVSPEDLDSAKCTITAAMTVADSEAVVLDQCEVEEKLQQTRIKDEEKEEKNRIKKEKHSKREEERLKKEQLLRVAAQERLDKRVVFIRELLPRLRDDDAAKRQAAVQELKGSLLGSDNGIAICVRLHETSLTLSERQLAFTFNQNELSLRHLRLSGFSAMDSRRCRATVGACIAAGYTCAELASGGYSVAECRRVGCCWADIFSAQFPGHQVERAVNSLNFVELNAALNERELDASGLSIIRQRQLLMKDLNHGTGDNVSQSVQAQARARIIVQENKQLRTKLAEAEQALRAAEDAASREAAAAIRAAKDDILAMPPAEATDATFMARYLAFRQHVETLLLYVPGKTALSRLWRLRIHREDLCTDVLGHFSDAAKMRLFQPTEVTFIDAQGEEAGFDQGGLTEALFSSFFSQVTQKQASLFEGVDDGEASISRSIGVLPEPSVQPDQMKAIGRIICRCVLADRPIGSGIGRFVFEYLADAHEQRVFHEPRAALVALADYDPDLAHRWSSLLAEPLAGLSLDLFDPNSGDVSEVAATPEAFGRAIIAGCRHRLLSCRERSLAALRDGFTEHIDLRIQLGALSSAELVLMLRGKTELSRKDLLECFE